MIVDVANNFVGLMTCLPMTANANTDGKCCSHPR
jgi:hypothetical protein